VPAVALGETDHLASQADFCRFRACRLIPPNASVPRSPREITAELLRNARIGRSCEFVIESPAWITLAPVRARLTPRDWDS
jgi:hypothetical protein